MAMVPLTADSVGSSKWISIRGCIEKGRVLVLKKNQSALVMSAKLLSFHGAQDITEVMGSRVLVL